MGVIIKQNLKIICSYNMLRARTFRTRRKSLRARNAHAYNHACNFFRLGGRITMTYWK